MTLYWVGAGVLILNSEQKLLEPDFQVTDLDNVDLVRATMMVTPLRANLENTYIQYTNGFLSEEFYSEVAVRNCRMYGPLILKLDLPITGSFRKELQRILAA